MAASHSINPESNAMPKDLNPEQALSLVGLGLMQKLSREGQSKLRLVEDNHEKVQLTTLREKLETISLAIETGAPLTTAEVTLLFGAKPGSDRAQRGGLLAKRISRNVWKLSKGKNEDTYWRN